MLIKLGYTLFFPLQNAFLFCSSFVFWIPLPLDLTFFLIIFIGPVLYMEDVPKIPFSFLFFRTSFLSFFSQQLYFFLLYYCQSNNYFTSMTNASHNRIWLSNKHHENCSSVASCKTLQIARVGTRLLNYRGQMWIGVDHI